MASSHSNACLLMMVICNLVPITSELLHNACDGVYDCPNSLKHALLTLKTLEKRFCSFMSPLFHAKIASLCLKDCKRKVLVLALEKVINIPNHYQEGNAIICFIRCFIIRL